MRRGSADALANRAGVRSGGRGGVRYAGGRGGVRYGSGGRGGVRYGSAWRSGYGGGRYYSYGGYGWGRSWRGSRFAGYFSPCGWGGSWGVFWNPWWYSCYSPYWIGGVPAFGFGVTWGGSGGDCYDCVQDQPPVVIEQTIIIEQDSSDLVEEGEALEEGPAEEPVKAEEEEDAPEAPGLEDFKAGIEAFRGGDFETALKHFRSAAEAEETNGEAWMAVFQSAFAEGEYTESAEALAVAADIGAFPRGYRFDPRPIYPNEKVFEKALQLLDKHLKKHTDDADAYLVRTYFHVAEGEREEAHAGILRVLELRPDDQTAPLLSIALLPPLPPEKIEDPAAPGAANTPQAPDER